MSSIQKLLNKISNNPKNVSFNDVQRLLSYSGYTLISSRGSHFKYKKNNCPNIFIPVHDNKVPEVYIRRIIYILHNIII